MESGPRLPAPTAPDQLGSLLDAIESEIEAAGGAAAGRHFDLHDGWRLHRGVSGVLYAFTAELLIPLQPETPIQLRERDETAAGALIAVDDFDVLVQLDEDRGERIAVASMTTRPAFILEALRDRLLECSPSAGAAGLLSGASPVVSGSNDSSASETSQLLEQLADPGLVPNEAQRQAMSRIAGSNLHFVWGPPGTGKTANVAQVVRMLVAAGERVLVLAHANVAVDVAMLRIADAFRGTDQLALGRIVRLGTPQHPDAAARDEILVDGILGRLDPGRMLERSELEARRRKLADKLRSASDDGTRDELFAELHRVRNELSRLRAEHKQMADEVVQEAAVVGATLSRLVLSSALWTRAADAVLLDEASMISIPWVIAAATRASRRLAVFGDFRQLPPVFVSEKKSARRWLGQDAFDLVGIRARVDEGDQSDERVTMLETQYRMALPIGTAVSQLAYGGRLKTDPAAAERSARLAAVPPHPGTSLLLVDTSLLRSACQLEATRLSLSRVNPVHVLLGLSLSRVSSSRRPRSSLRIARRPGCLPPA
jgi:hypothetical protein